MLIDLREDRYRLHSYLLDRIHRYRESLNIGPGEPEDPIRLITIGYYASQGGYVNLVFDTRADAEHDGNWTLFIEEEVNTLDFPHWADALSALFEGEPLRIIRHDGETVEILGAEEDRYLLKTPDGEEVVLDDEADPDPLQAQFGEMVADVLQELIRSGSFQHLPLAEEVYVMIEEFDGGYYWPSTGDDQWQPHRLV